MSRRFEDLEAEGEGGRDSPEQDLEEDSDDRAAIDDRRLSDISIYSSDSEVASLTGVTAGRHYHVLSSSDDDDSDFEELLGKAKAMSPQFNNRGGQASQELPHMVRRLERQDDIEPQAVHGSPVAAAAAQAGDQCYFTDVGDLPVNSKTGKQGRGCKFFSTLNGPELIINQAADYAKRFADQWPKNDNGKYDATFRNWKYMLVVQETGEVERREHLHALFISDNNSKRSYKNVRDTFFNGAAADVKTCRNETNACIYLRKGDQPKAEYESLFADGPHYGDNLRIVCEAGNAPKYNKRGRATGARQALVDTMKKLQEESDTHGGFRAYMQQLFDEHGGTCLSAMNAIKAVGNLWVPDREEGPRTVIFHIGLTGGGKTRSALQYAKNSGKPFLFLTASGNFCFDNLWNEKIIILDDFRGQHISFSAVLNITDVTNGVEVKARYSNKLMTADEFHFCCPVHPSELWGHLEENLEGKMSQLARRTTEIRLYGAPGPETVVNDSGETVLKANPPMIFQTTLSDYKTAWSQSKEAWLRVQNGDKTGANGPGCPRGVHGGTQRCACWGNRGFLNP